MTTTIVIRNTADTEINEVDFTELDPGETSSAQTIRVYNSGDAAPISCYVVALNALAKYTGGTNNQGQEAITEQWLEAKEGAGPWTHIGGDITQAANRLAITPPGALSYTDVALRLVVPLGAVVRGGLTIQIALFYPEG